MTLVQIVSIANANAWQAAKAEEARKLIEAGINSKKFQSAVLGARLLDVSFENPDGTVLSGLSNQQVLDLILFGTERGTRADYIIQLHLVLYSKLWSSALGWTDDHGHIHTHHKFFNRADPIEIAGHWLHEWTHAAGFRHDYGRTARRDWSVPYLIGELLLDSVTPSAQSAATSV